MFGVIYLQPTIDRVLTSANISYSTLIGIITIQSSCVAVPKLCVDVALT